MPVLAAGHDVGIPGGTTLPVARCADDGSAGTLRSATSFSQDRIVIPVEINEFTVHGPATSLIIDARDVGVATDIGAHELQHAPTMRSSSPVSNPGACINVPPMHGRHVRFCCQSTTAGVVAECGSTCAASL